MAYKVFYTDVPLPREMSQADFSRLIPFSFDALDAALAKACEIVKRGEVVWKIEGPQGVEMDRAQVEKACAPDQPKGTLRPGRSATATAPSTGGMSQKQHRDRNVHLPPKPPSR